MKRNLGRFRQFLTLLAIFAVLLGAFPFSAVAENDTEYISDLRIAIAPTWDEAVKILTDAGYRVVEQDLNEGTGDDALCVCLGYKITIDPTEALTDIAILNMNAKYSYADTDAIERLCSENLDDAVETVQTAVSEMKTSYSNGSRVAKWAFITLNNFIDDKTETELGTLLFDGADDETVRRILKDGNLVTVSLLFSLLYIGNGESTGKSLITVIKESETEFSPAVERHKIATELLEKIDTIKTPLETYRNASVKWDAESEDLTAYIETLSDDELGDYLTGGAFETVLGDTYSDLLFRDNLRVSDLYFIANAMSDGQRAVAKYVSADLILFGGYDNIPKAETEDDTPTEENPDESEDGDSESDTDETVETTETIEDATDVIYLVEDQITSERISICAGLRSYLTGSSSFALSEDAGDYSEQNIDLRWIWDGDVFTDRYNWILSAVYENLLTVTMTVGSGVVFPSLDDRNNGDPADFFWYYQRNRSKTEIPLICAEQLTGLDVTGMDAVSMLSAGALCAISSLYDGEKIFYDTNSMSQYKKIPENVIHLRADKNYAIYSAVVQDVAETVTVENNIGDDIPLSDAVGMSADLNAWSGIQWSAVYTTKDSKAGSPILAKNFMALADQEQSALEHNVVHAFGSRLSYDLNQYAKENTLGGLYLYFDRDMSYGEKTTTAFSRLDLCLAIGGASVGGIIIGAVAVYVTYETARKKKEDKAKKEEQ